MKFAIHCLVAVCTIVGLGAHNAEAADAYTSNPTIQRLHQLTNAHRARMGLPALALNPAMCAQAQQHANWMASTGSMTHSNMGYAEIIFMGPANADGAINGWIYSPSHHSIMLSGREVGFGYQNYNGRPSWVGIFR